MYETGKHMGILWAVWELFSVLVEEITNSFKVRCDCFLWVWEVLQHPCLDEILKRAACAKSYVLVNVITCHLPTHTVHAHV